MHDTWQSAAKHTRSLVQNDRMTPAAFRTAFDDVPAPHRDQWLDVLWDTGELPDDDPALPSGCVPYLPCPVAAVLDAVQQIPVTQSDMFVDVGSGAGRAAVLAHLLTGAGSLGLEIQPALAKSSQARADWLGLTRTRFIAGDAAELCRFIPLGTVFFLYCPFGTAHLQRFRDTLEDGARSRQIRICCVDMPPLKRPWLTQVPTQSPRIDVYQSARLGFNRTTPINLNRLPGHGVV